MRKLLIAATMLAGLSAPAFAGSDNFHCTSADCHAGPSTGVQQGVSATGGNATQSGIISQTPTLNQSGSQVGNSRNANNNVSSNRNTNTSSNTNRVSNGSASASRSSGGGASVGNSGNTTYRAAANVASLPSVGGGGFDCPVVGVGLSGSVVTGSGVGIASWISSKCNTRKLAEMMVVAGHPDAAMYLLAKDDSDVADALKMEADNAPDAPPFVPSAWCAKASKIERTRNPGSCGPQPQ